MADITKIEVQKTRSDRVNLFVDNVFYMGVPLAAVATLRLYEGQELTDNLRERLLATSSDQEVRARALWLLGRHPYSTARLTRKLLERYESGLVADTVADLARLGLVDDLALAKGLVASWKNAKSKLEIRSKLLARGLGNVAAAAMEELEDLDQATALDKILARKVADPQQLTIPAFYEKTVRYLAAKGFSYNQIREALKKLGRDAE